LIVINELSSENSADAGDKVLNHHLIFGTITNGNKLDIEAVFHPRLAQTSDEYGKSFTNSKNHIQIQLTPDGKIDNSPENLRKLEALAKSEYDMAKAMSSVSNTGYIPKTPEDYNTPATTFAKNSINRGDNGIV